MLSGERTCRTLVLTFCVLACSAAHLAGSEREAIRIDSPSMGTRLRANVFLPKSYCEQTRPYPVIFMLHGYGGSHRSWPSVAPLGKYADAHEVILVCPSGGRASWYLDSPVRSDSRFETHIVNEACFWRCDSKDS